MCVVDEVVVFLSFLRGSEVYFLDVDSFRKVVNAQNSHFLLFRSQSIEDAAVDSSGGLR